MVDSPLFLFAPGAGAPSSHSWMRHWTELLKTLGAVWTFDYPYMIEGRKRPDPLPRLIASHREALLQARETHSGPTVLIGKSMGARIGCHLAIKEEVAAVICLGYPLCGGGDTTRLRDEVLLELSTPVLFVQGTRDPLCPLNLLEQVRARMRAANELYVVEDGNHSLIVTKRGLLDKGQTQENVDEHILAEIRKFIRGKT
jgi:predicted alpha/beta-hydrolase family hydrolase